MNKNDFLATLRESLKNEISQQDIENNIKYYDEYINNQSLSQMDEYEVIHKLGDPRLIAKTIIDTSKISNQTKFNKEDKYYYSEFINSNVQEDNQNAENKKHRIAFSIFTSNRLIDRILRMFIFGFVIFIILILITFAVRLFFIIGIPILMILFFVRLLTRR